jgi:hypothetical protein
MRRIIAKDYWLDDVLVLWEPYGPTGDASRLSVSWELCGNVRSRAAWNAFNYNRAQGLRDRPMTNILEIERR